MAGDCDAEDAERDIWLAVLLSADKVKDTNEVSDALDLVIVLRELLVSAEIKELNGILIDETKA